MVLVSITTKRAGPRASRGEIYKYVHKQLIRLWKECVAEFVRTAAQEIAVDTGMSRASLEPLAAQVGLASALAESARGFGVAPRKGVFDIDGNYNNAGMRSKAAGRQAGQKAYELDFGTTMNPRLRFKFEIVVWQHKVHELGMFGNDPWRSLEKGRGAFLQHFNAQYPRIPKAPIYSMLGRLTNV